MVSAKEVRKGGRQQGATKQYNPTQLSVIEKHTAEGWGPGRIIKMYPALGLTVNGIKSAQKRIRKNGQAAPVEEKRGAKKTKRTPETNAKIHSALRKSKASSIRQISNPLRRDGVEIDKETVRRALRKDLKMQSFRTVKGQKLSPKKKCRQGQRMRQVETNDG